MAEQRDRAHERIERLNQRFANLAGWCFDHRFVVALLCVALFAGSFLLASKVEQDASYESYFNEGDDTYEAYQKYLDDFGSDEVSYIGYEIPELEHGVWNVEAMAALIDADRGPRGRGPLRLRGDEPRERRVHARNRRRPRGHAHPGRVAAVPGGAPPAPRGLPEEAPAGRGHREPGRLLRRDRHRDGPHEHGSARRDHLGSEEAGRRSRESLPPGLRREDHGDPRAARSSRTTTSFRRATSP